MSFLGTVGAAIAGNLANQMLGGGSGGGGGGGQQIQAPPRVSLTRHMRQTGRRGSRAKRSVAAKAASPSIYGGGATRYNAILKSMLKDVSTIKQAKAPKA